MDAHSFDTDFRRMSSVVFPLFSPSPKCGGFMRGINVTFANLFGRPLALSLPIVILPHPSAEEILSALAAIVVVMRPDASRDCKVVEGGKSR